MQVALPPSPQRPTGIPGESAAVRTQNGSAHGSFADVLSGLSRSSEEGETLGVTSEEAKTKPEAKPVPGAKTKPEAEPENGTAVESEEKTDSKADQAVGIADSGILTADSVTPALVAAAVAFNILPAPARTSAPESVDAKDEASDGHTPAASVQAEYSPEAPLVSMKFPAETKRHIPEETQIADHSKASLASTKFTSETALPISEEAQPADHLVSAEVPVEGGGADSPLKEPGNTTVIEPHVSIPEHDMEQAHVLPGERTDSKRQTATPVDVQRTAIPVDIHQTATEVDIQRTATPVNVQRTATPVNVQQTATEALTKHGEQSQETRETNKIPPDPEQGKAHSKPTAGVHTNIPAGETQSAQADPPHVRAERGPIPHSKQADIAVTPSSAETIEEPISPPSNQLHRGGARPADDRGDAALEGGSVTDVEGSESAPANRNGHPSIRRVLARLRGNNRDEHDPAATEDSSRHAPNSAPTPSGVKVEAGSVGPASAGIDQSTEAAPNTLNVADTTPSPDALVTQSHQADEAHHSGTLASSSTPVGGGPFVRPAIAAAWLRSLLSQQANGTGKTGDWQVLNVNLDDGNGHVTVKARHDDDQISVSVGFSDPRLQAQVQVNARQIEQTLEAQYHKSVNLSFHSGGEGGGASGDHRQDGASTASGKSIAAEPEKMIERPHARTTMGLREWVG